MAFSSPLIPQEIQNWLLDPVEPGPRYLSLKYLSKNPPLDLAQASQEALNSGPIKTILDAMDTDGYWDNDGPGYLPKYRSTVWSIISLYQLGASVQMDKRIELACKRYLDHALNEGGQISTNGPPSGTVDCLQGNVLASLTALGYEDPRLDLAYEWMARTTTGEGISPMSDKKADRRYYSGKIGPDFQCGANNKESCAWGAAKVMMAFSLLDKDKRTPLIDQAIQRGQDFLFSCDPASAEYPNGWNAKPSGNWWKFGFPVFYVSDILQICQAMANLGLRDDPRLENALELVLEKRTPEGNWLMEYGYQGKTWEDYGQKKKPNKWVTIRAYRALGSFLTSS